jgi:hypothetical protein
MIILLSLFDQSHYLQKYPPTWYATCVTVKKIELQGLESIANLGRPCCNSRVTCLQAELSLTHSLCRNVIPNRLAQLTMCMPCDDLAQEHIAH